MLKLFLVMFLMVGAVCMQLRMANDAGASVKEDERAFEKDKFSPEFSGKIKVNNRAAKLFFMPASHEKNAIADYIGKRSDVLAKLSKENPSKELNAQISFSSYLSADQLVAFIKKSRLVPLGLNIGWKKNGGGYDLKEGESIEVAVRSATLHHEHFIAQLQEDANIQVFTLRDQGADDSEMQSELAFQKHVNELAFVFQTHGILFYGIRVAGRAEQLHDLANQDKGKIRLIDPLWGGSVEKEIAELYPIIKIGMPIMVDNHKLLP